MQSHQLTIRSAAFPAGDLLTSYYDRDVTRLSDRGLASNMIGDRWSDLCAAHLQTWPGTHVPLPDGTEIAVSQVVRLDDIPRIATVASRRKLQNPDFIVVGQRNSDLQMFAVDAKFSIDTAKSSQVSAETLDALLALRDEVPNLLPELPENATIVDGYFLSPDTSLTAWVMGKTRGRFTLSVPTNSVMLIEARPVPFLKPLEGARLIAPLAQLDGFRDEIRTNSLLAMYYFRLARASFGAYLETKSPIIGAAASGTVDLDEFEQATIAIARTAASAWDVVLRWDARADQIRTQREAVYQAMPFPVAGKALRERLIAEAELRGVDPPSMNSVRRRVATWHRLQFDERIGPVYPPVEDLPALLGRIHDVAREVQPLVEEAVTNAIEQAFAHQDAETV